MNIVNDGREFFQRNLYAVLAVVVIAAVGLGYGFFLSSSINPGLQAQDQLTTQLADARKALGEAQQAQTESPGKLQTRFAGAQATLTAALTGFLTDAEASQFLNALPQQARASGVQIIELQTLLLGETPPAPTQPGPTRAAPLQTGTAPPSPSPTPPSAGQGQTYIYHVTSIRLRVQGSPRQLVDFASRIREASAKGFVVNRLNLAGGEAPATLTMEITLYTVP
jgi:type II secretory pathway pseudopilin PulG